jgi:hypothetical protein
MRTDHRLGDKLGPRLADLMAQVTIATRRGLAPHEARVAQVAAQALIDRAGEEVAGLWRPLIREALDDPDSQHHPLLAGHLEAAASGRDQWQAIAGLAAGGVSGALGSIFNNGFAGLARSINAANPITSPDQNTAAILAATGLVGFDTAAYWAAGMGYPGDTFQALYELAQHAPALAELQDMMNRGLMAEGDADAWLRRNGYPDSVRPRLLELRRVILAPADAALAVLRGNMTQAEGESAAAHAGVDAGDFTILIGNTGEPLALESLLEARRRGFIDDARLDKGIRQSRVRDEWIDVAHKLEYAPMSAADAIMAYVQGHITEAASRAKVVQNGVEAGDFDALYATAGEPLSRTEMEQLYNRGLATRAEVEQAIRESRVKDKYVSMAFDLHTRLPEGRQIVSMVSHGAATKAEALGLLGDLGYSPQVAGLLVAEGTSTRLAAHHALTLGEIRQLYIERIFTAAHARDLLAGLGYDDADAGYLLAAWDLAAGAAITRQAVGVIRGRYVAHVIDDQAASMDLDALGIAATARDQYLHVWGIERQAVVRVLTEAQIVAAHKKSLITGADALARLAALGYTDPDAHLLLGVLPGTDPDAGA